MKEASGIVEDSTLNVTEGIKVIHLKNWGNIDENKAMMLDTIQLFAGSCGAGNIPLVYDLAEDSDYLHISYALTTEGFTGAPSRFDEYRIVVDVNSGIEVTAPTPAGIFYGTATLLQMVQRRDGLVTHGIYYDYSDIQERGLSLDVARKPYSIEWIRKMIDYLAMVKMNSLQLHLSDNEGFVVKTDADQKLYGESVAVDYAMTKQELVDLILYAKQRYVAVIPEFDTPGHFHSFSVFLQHHGVQKGYTFSSNNLNVTNPDAVGFAQAILAELIDLTKDHVKAFHTGADEYFGFNREDEIVQYNNDRLKQITDAGLEARQWNDDVMRAAKNYTVATPPGTVVGYWSQNFLDDPKAPYATINDIIGAGFEVINLNQHYLYYSKGHKEPVLEEIYNEWTPLVFAGTTVGFENQQVVDASFADQVRGTYYAIWSDGVYENDVWDTNMVFEDTKLALRCLAEKSWAYTNFANNFKQFNELLQSWDPVLVAGTTDGDPPGPPSGSLPVFASLGLAIATALLF